MVVSGKVCRRKKGQNSLEIVYNKIIKKFPQFFTKHCKLFTDSVDANFSPQT